MIKIKTNPEQAQGVFARSELVHSAQRVADAVNSLAVTIGDTLRDKDPLVLCVMNGGVIATALVLNKLAFPLRLDYLHATRYQGATSGAVLEWLTRPRWPLRNENVLVIDDIFDEGTTLERIVQFCREQGAHSVYSAVLVEKIRPRICPYRPDFVGLTVPDRYVFGAGMDYKEYWRNLSGIYAVAEADL
jgi:hypoxanthine phosphoribosyltransferase